MAIMGGATIGATAASVAASNRAVEENKKLNITKAFMDASISSVNTYASLPVAFSFR
jgi:hypothetical protein